MFEKIIEPIIEHNCKGKMIYNSDIYNVVFQVRQLPNGLIIGNIQTSLDFFKIMRIFEATIAFSLSGTNESGNKIIVNNCHINKFENNSLQYFAYESVLNPEMLQNKIQNDIRLDFWLLNVYETFRVIIETDIGKLFLAHFKDIKDRLALIKTQKLSVITSIAEIYLNNNFIESSLDKIISDGEKTISNFLRITSLAQTCYHDWCYLEIYEKENDSDNYRFILSKMSNPKSKIPTFRGLTNRAHSNRFIKSAYSGYLGREVLLRKLYDFDIALEWYLESFIASVGESKYLALCTCLELLVDRYETYSKHDYILDPVIFKKDLRPELKKTAQRILKKIKTSKDQRAEIYSKLGELNRWSFKTGILRLIKYLGVKYDDLFDDLQEIIDVRNQITHTGVYEDFYKLIKVYDRLSILLSRIFLAILNYDGEYWDWLRDGFINFNEVCNKNSSVKIV